MTIKQKVLQKWMETRQQVHYLLDYWVLPGKQKDARMGAYAAGHKGVTSRLHWRQSTEIQQQEEEKLLAQIQPCNAFPSPVLYKEAII